MDINKLSREILKKNLGSNKVARGISGKKLRTLLLNRIKRIDGETVVFGYKKDVEKFKRYMPKDFGQVKFEYTEPKDWKKDFGNLELIHRIEMFPCARLILVSEDMRYLLAANLISNDVLYEIVDIYELIKMDYDIVLKIGIGTTLEKKLEEGIKKSIQWVGVFLAKWIKFLSRLKCIGYWQKSIKEKCDYYDGIFVKKYYYQTAQDPEAKKYYIGEIIVDYLKIKDFVNAFYYIDEFIRLFGGGRGIIFYK